MEDKGRHRVSGAGCGEWPLLQHLISCLLDSIFVQKKSALSVASQSLFCILLFVSIY
jgi:hypothetical protein